MTLAVVGGACGAAVHRVANDGVSGDDITLFRGGVGYVRQRIAVELPAGASTVRLELPADAKAEDLDWIDRGGLELGAIHLCGDEPPAPGTVKARCASIEVGAPSAGHYTLTVAYPTKLPWDAAYTMTTSAAHDRATIRGSIAIRNATGVAYHVAHLRVVDSTVEAGIAARALALSASLAGTNVGTSPRPEARDLGTVELRDGETRVPLLVDAKPRRIRSILVYDPIGVALDTPSPASIPSEEPELGVTTPASTRVAESIELARSASSRGLPAGPVRLLDSRDDGTLAVVGEAQMFDDATRVAQVDTIELGTAVGVTAHRERRELSIDEDTHRIVEEFGIAIDNARSVPVTMLLREHLYRGQNWAIAYASVPSTAVSKAGAQEITLRARVPAHTNKTVVYVVVYSW